MKKQKGDGQISIENALPVHPIREREGFGTSKKDRKKPADSYKIKASIVDFIIGLLIGYSVVVIVTNDWKIFIGMQPRWVVCTIVLALIIITACIVDARQKE